MAMHAFAPIWFVSGAAGFVLALHAYHEDRSKRRWLLAAISAPLLMFFGAGTVALVFYWWVASKNGRQILPTPN